MSITGDSPNEIRVRVVVDKILEGKLERALTSGGLLLSPYEFKSLQTLEFAASEGLVLQVATALIGMRLKAKPYSVRVAATPIGPQLELIES